MHELLCWAVEAVTTSVSLLAADDWAVAVEWPVVWPEAHAANSSPAFSAATVRKNPRRDSLALALFLSLPSLRIVT